MQPPVPPQPPVQQPQTKPPRPLWAKVLILGAAGVCGFFLLLCGISVVGVAMKQSKEGAPPPTNGVTQAAAAAEPVTEDEDEIEMIEVTAAKLTSDYESNELRADSTYKDKWVQVTGKAGSIAKDILGDPYVTVGTGKQIEIRSVQCMIAENEISKASNLSTGEDVTVVGRVDGLMMNVLLRDCRIR